jgi:hypothetical protein
MRLEIELRFTLFPLIILEMFQQLDWSPPVVNSIDWTWFGKAHTYPYKVSQLTVHVRVKNQAMRLKELSVELRDRIVSRHRSGEGYQNISAALKVPKNTVNSFLNGRSLEPPRLFLDQVTRPRTQWSWWFLSGERNQSGLIRPYGSGQTEATSQ